MCESCEAAYARIKKILTQAAIEEMHEKDEAGRTAFTTAVVADAPVELLERMAELGKQDTKKRSIATIGDKDGYCPLDFAWKLS